MSYQKFLSILLALGATFAQGALADDSGSKLPVTIETSAAAVVTTTNQPSVGTAGGAVGSAKITIPTGATEVTVTGSAGATTGSTGTQVLGGGSVALKPVAGIPGVVVTGDVDCTNPALCSVGTRAGVRLPLKNGGIDIEARLPAVGGVIFDRTQNSSPMAWIVGGGRVSLDQKVGDLLKINAFLEGDATSGLSSSSPTGANQQGLGFVGLQGLGVEYKVGRHVVLFGNLAVTEEMSDVKTVSSETVGVTSSACTTGGHGDGHGGDDGHGGHDGDGDDGHGGHGGTNPGHGGTNPGHGGTTTTGGSTTSTQTINQSSDSNRWNIGVEGQAGVRFVF